MVQAHGIWLCNVAAFNVYTRLHKTQWRTAGMGGLIGLDYASLPFFLELERVPRADWPEVTDDLQTMEAEALVLMRKQAKS